MQSPLYKNARIYIDGHFQIGGFEVTGRREVVQFCFKTRLCQSMAAKTPKTPGFPTKMGTQGLFCSLDPMRIHLQPFISISVDLAAQPPPETQNLLGLDPNLRRNKR